MNSGIQVTGYKTIASGDAALTKAIGTIGPITANIYAASSKFRLYKSGVYSISIRVNGLEKGRGLRVYLDILRLNNLFRTCIFSNCFSAFTNCMFRQFTW